MFLPINQILCRKHIDMYSNRNKAPPPTHVREHSSVTSKSIFNEKHLRHRIRGIPARRTQERTCPLPRWTGVGNGSSRRAGGDRGTCCPECVRPPRSRRGPGPSSGWECAPAPLCIRAPKRNKNKHKLKDNCQAGEDDDNHLSTFSCAYCLCRNSGNGQKCTKVTCLTSEDRKILFIHGGRSPCEICKQRYKIL